MTERIRAYRALDHTRHRTGCHTSSTQLQQGTNRAGPLSTTTKRPEVLQSNKRCRPLVEPDKINFSRQPGDLIAIQRIRRHARIAQPVDVAAPDRRKAGVEPSRSNRNLSHYTVPAQHTVEAPGEIISASNDLFWSHEAGIAIFTGTDAGGSLPHGLVAQEMVELTRAGLSTLEALDAGVWAARAWLGRPGIEEGEDADFVVYGADPREDVTVVAEPKGIVLRGRVVR